jgi:hypothetical protein
MTRRLERVTWILALGAALVLHAWAANATPTVCLWLGEPTRNEADPEGDFDQDGWTNAQECGWEGGWYMYLNPGLSVPDPLSPGADLEFVPSCWGYQSERQLCMEASEPDVFVALVPADPSGLPENLFELTSMGRLVGGLGVAMHQLKVTDPAAWSQTRLVSPFSTQRAVTLTELLDLDGEYLGIGNYGTPNNLDRARIWTARIERFVTETCGDPSCETCEAFLSSNGQDPERWVCEGKEVTKMLALWVANHEVGHMFKLTRDFNNRFGGYHLRATEDAVMAQFPVYQKNRKTGKTTFFMPGIYHESSLLDARFK